MKIFGSNETRMASLAQATVDLAGSCAKESSLYKELYETLPKDFSKYEYALQYFLAVFKPIENYRKTRGVFIDRTHNQALFHNGMKYLKDYAFPPDSNGILCADKRDGKPVVVKSHTDLVSLTLVQCIREAIYNEAKHNTYYARLYDALPDIFDKHRKSKDLKKFICEFLSVADSFLKENGEFPRGKKLTKKTLTEILGLLAETLVSTEKVGF